MYGINGLLFRPFRALLHLLEIRYIIPLRGMLTYFALSGLGEVFLFLVAFATGY
jgi:hypothetical protein